MGSDRVTVRNIEVVRVDAEANTLVVRGSIPGAAGGYLVIRKKG
jgi:large subunit ribosomal protein L3